MCLFFFQFLNSFTIPLQTFHSSSVARPRIYHLYHSRHSFSFHPPSKNHCYVHVFLHHCLSLGMIIRIYTYVNFFLNNFQKSKWNKEMKQTSPPPPNPATTSYHMYMEIWVFLCLFLYKYLGVIVQMWFMINREKKFYGSRWANGLNRLNIHFFKLFFFANLDYNAIAIWWLIDNSQFFLHILSCKMVFLSFS